MNTGPVMLDSDMLSELSRGHRAVTERVRVYLDQHGSLTISAITVFERMCGYRLALHAGKPFAEQFRKFEALVATCRVLPVDQAVAAEAALIWVNVPGRIRRHVGDIFIAATASVHGLPLVTRNRRDFTPMARVGGVNLSLLDWAR